MVYANIGNTNEFINLDNCKNIICNRLANNLVSGPEMYPYYLFADMNTFTVSLNGMDENSDIYKYFSEVYGVDIISRITPYIGLNIDDLIEESHTLNISLPVCEIVSGNFLSNRGNYDLTVYLSQNLKTITVTNLSNTSMYINYVSDVLPSTGSFGTYPVRHIFNDGNNNLYVPSEMVSLYEASSVWNYSVNIIAYDFDNNTII